MKPLTAKQVECLRKLARPGRDPFDCFFASTTISRLRKDGLITGVTYYDITDAGREALKGAR